MRIVHLSRSGLLLTMLCIAGTALMQASQGEIGRESLLQQDPSDRSSPQHQRGDDDDRRFDRFRGRDRRPPEITPELRERMIEVIRDLRPSLTEENIEQLRAMPPDRFRDQVVQRAGRILYLARLKKDLPDLYEVKVEELTLNSRIFALAREYRSALAAKQEPQAGELRSTLETLLSRQWDLRMRARELEIAAFEQRLQRMREELEQDRTEKHQHIERWLDDLRKGGMPHPGFEGRRTDERRSRNP